jgi:amino acid transporter
MFFNSTQSLTATDIMTAVIIVNFTAANIACLAAASRQVWAFARNHGLPFSNFIAPVRTLFLAPTSTNFYRVILHMICLLMQYLPL